MLAVVVVTDMMAQVVLEVLEVVVQVVVEIFQVEYLEPQIEVVAVVELVKAQLVVVAQA
jgi:hypothetical protein